MDQLEALECGLLMMILLQTGRAIPVRTAEKRVRRDTARLISIPSALPAVSAVSPGCISVESIISCNPASDAVRRSKGVQP
jgi:hypothetical protein